MTKTITPLEFLKKEMETVFAGEGSWFTDPKTHNAHLENIKYSFCIDEE